MIRYLLFLFLLINIKINSQNKALKVERFAVLDFTLIANNEDQEKYKWMEHGFSETLNDAFSRIPQFSIIERTQLDKILKEQQIQQTNKFDSTSAVNVGKLLGVKMVLIGSCQIYTRHLLVNMRIVNVETGEIKPIDNLPIIASVDSVLHVQKKLCLEILHQFNISNDDLAIREIQNVTSKSTKSLKAYEFLNKGLDLFKNQQYNEALDMYSIALAYDKKYHKAYYGRGLTNYALKQYEKAAGDFSNSTNYIRQDSIFQLMSDAYYKQGLYKKSYEYIKKAEKINPKSNSIKKSLLQFENIKLIDNNLLKKTDSLEFETIYEFINNRAKVKLNGKYGFIDNFNNVIIPIVFDEIGSFTKGLAPARINSKWGFINNKGYFIIEPQFSSVVNFDNKGLAKVVSKDKWGIIDTTGKIILPIEFANQYYYSNWSSAELMVVSKYKNVLALDYIQGVYNDKGNEIIPIIYEEIDLPSWYEAHNSKTYPYILAALNGKWGVINLNNDLIIPFKYEKNCIREFKNRFAAIKVNEKWGFVNLKGLEIIEPKYERVNDFTPPFLSVKLRGKWGVLDTNNIQLIPCSYDALNKAENDNWTAMKDNFFGVIDSKNIEQVPFIYNKLTALGKGFWAAKKGDFWGIIDSKNNITCDFIFETMISEQESRYYISGYGYDKYKVKVEVTKSGKKYWINEAGKCVYDCK